MKTVKVLSVLLLLAVFGVSLAYADTLSGKIVSTDLTANSISLNVMNSETHAEEKLSVNVNAETTYTGVASLSDLKEGQEISIEAAKDANGVYGATKVELKIAEAAPTITEPASVPVDAPAAPAEEAKM